MKIHNLKSNAKINLSLNIISKLKTKMHKIESIVTFIDLADMIQISESKKTKHQVKFYGKFSKGLSGNNTVNKVLNLMDNKKCLNGKKYKVKIKKNIPTKSGLGGGSMNAATILSFFLKKKIINLKQANYFAKNIGSDVLLGINNKSKILYCDNSYKEFDEKIIFYLVLLKPKFGCSTNKVYSHNAIFSKKNYFKNKKIKITKNYVAHSKNDLENSAFKLYPKLQKLKNSLIASKMGKFVRMTGSGSTIVVYFNSRVAAKNALKIYKRKFNKNWCILSKII